MTSIIATVAALLFVSLPFANPTSAQVPAGAPASAPQVSRRAETQAVVDACREKKHNAETRHTLMVFKAAQALLKVKSAFPEIAGADPLTVEIAATLHDIGGGGLVNAHPGAVITRDVLTSLAETHRFSPAFIDKIERIVETHHITGAVKGKDDGPDWYLVILADTPRIYSASPDDEEAFAKLIRDRIDQVKATLGQPRLETTLCIW